MKEDLNRIVACLPSWGDDELKKTRILLADDHQIIREGLRALIDAEPDMEVVAEASSGREAIDLVRSCKPDLVVMDIEMKGLNGIEATRRIRKEIAETKVLMLSVHLDRKYVAESLKAGASGYLLKDCAFEELCKAVRRVMFGSTYVSSNTMEMLMKDYVRLLEMNGEESVFSILTEREKEVLQLLTEGLPIKKIAATLFLSSKTIETHLSNIKKKLKIRSVAELTKYAIGEGLTYLDN